MAFWLFALACEVAVDSAGAPLPPWCAVPNPVRGTIDDSREPVDQITNGDMEEASPLAKTEGDGKLLRMPSAARGGQYGLELHANEDMALVWPAVVEGAEDITYRVYVKSLGEPVSLTLEANYDAAELGPTSEPVTVGADWTLVTLSATTPQSVEAVRMRLHVPTGAYLAVDDAAVTLPLWRYVVCEGACSDVGPLSVPTQPVAPVDFAVLIHVEDNPKLLSDPDTQAGFETVVERLATTLHGVGGALSVQTELEFVQAEGDRLRTWHEELGAEFAVHTHGPVCRDEAGKAVAASYCDPDSAPVEAGDLGVYLAERADAIGAAVGVVPTDFNGNFDTVSAAQASGAGLFILSAYKNKNDQTPLSNVYTNPWRPTDGDADADPTTFETDNPSSSLLYVPTPGPISNKPDRIEPQLERLVSQAIGHADADRVNSLYFVLNAGRFTLPRDADPDSSATLDGEVNAVGDALSTVVQPLVGSGHLRWRTMPEIGEEFAAWEEDCGR